MENIIFFCVLAISVVNCYSQGVDGDLRFLVIGDWGGLPFFPFRTPIEDTVAAQMGKFADKQNVQFVLALGDNFYFEGVQDIHDPRFQETYNSVFTASSLDTDWYFVAGNHDHNGNVSAQIEYSKLIKRWNFPHYFYGLQFKIPSSSSIVEIIMIDTVMLCGNSDSDFLYKQPTGPDSKLHADDQLSWIEKRLQSSTADYLIVAGHYPVFSVAEHGPTDCLVQQLLPLLTKYRATAYFCGHDHNIQHLQHAENNVTIDYFVSGAANFIDPSMAHENSVPPKSLRFHWANVLSLGSFSYVNVNAKNMTYTFYEANGDELYSYTLLPRKK